MPGLLIVAPNCDEQPSASFAKRRSELVRLSNVSDQVGAPLCEREVEEIVRQTFGAASPYAENLACRLHRYASGNAFFLQEVLRALVESGELPWWEANVELLPTSVRETIRERLVSLSDHALRVAEYLSVLGASTHVRVVQRLVPDAESLDAALEELVRCVEGDVTLGEAWVRFFAAARLRSRWGWRRGQ